MVGALDYALICALVEGRAGQLNSLHAVGGSWRMLVMLFDGWL